MSDLPRSASYTKLRDGSWGLRAQGLLRRSETVTVIARNGSAKLEVVGTEIYTDEDENGLPICFATIAGAKPGTVRRYREEGI